MKDKILAILLCIWFFGCYETKINEQTVKRHVCRYNYDDRYNHVDVGWWHMSDLCAILPNGINRSICPVWYRLEIEDFNRFVNSNTSSEPKPYRYFRLMRYFDCPYDYSPKIHMYIKNYKWPVTWNDSIQAFQVRGDSIELCDYRLGKYTGGNNMAEPDPGEKTEYRKVDSKE